MVSLEWSAVNRPSWRWHLAAAPAGSSPVRAHQKAPILGHCDWLDDPLAPLNPIADITHNGNAIQEALSSLAVAPTRWASADEQRQTTVDNCARVH